MVRTLWFRILIAFIKDCVDKEKARKQTVYLDKEKVFEKAKSIHAKEKHLQAPSEDCISGTFKGLIVGEMRLFSRDYCDSLSFIIIKSYRTV